MKKFFGFLFNKITLTVCLMLVQLLWILVFFGKLVEYTIWVTILFTIVSIAMFLTVIVSNQNSAYKIGWITIMSILPLIGGLFYLFMGNRRPSKPLKRRLLVSYDKLSDVIKQNHVCLSLLNPPISMTVKYIYESVGYPITDGTQCLYLDSGEEMYEKLLIDLKQAEDFIFFEYFIVYEGEMWDTIKEILIDKAKSGVDVRVILDDFGCIRLMNKRSRKELTDAGIKLLMFNPIKPVFSLTLNHRDHRKITVIDGKIGYTGGINIADEYINKKVRFGHWKDSAIRLEGKGVENLTLMFLRLFYAYVDIDEDYDKFFNIKDNYVSSAKGLVQCFSDSPMDDESTAENIYLSILWNAKDYVYIFTPYLIIDDELNSAICMAAKRGVDVRIVVPDIADKKTAFQLTKSYFKQLIMAGVKIYRYTPGFIHSKVLVCDDEIAVVGTINMDFRSLYLHFECGAMIINSDVIDDIKQDCINTFELSRRVSLIECDRGKLEHLLRAVLRLVSPLY